ncbi:MAG: HK97 gp10 family phage protein [PVC group bacterium]|nr:HK97 gp10 family phage protein [PVC group bacterium]
MAKFVPNPRVKSEIEKYLEKKLDLAAQQAVQVAQALVPKDTGNLERSLNWKKIFRLSRRIGTPVEYAPDVEFGLGQKPQPYLRPLINVKKYRELIVKVFRL